MSLNFFDAKGTATLRATLTRQLNLGGVLRKTGCILFSDLQMPIIDSANQASQGC